MRDFKEKLKQICDIEVDETNPSQPVTVKKVLHPLKQCSDCDLIIREQQRITSVCTFPQRYTKTKCLTCDTYMNPTTRKFGHTLKEINQEFRQIFRKNNQKIT